MTDPRQQALAWLHRTYGGLVELSHPEPLAESAATRLFGCRPAPQPGYPTTPMLAASVAVPKDGSVPFHPAAHDPAGDIAEFDRAPTPRTAEAQARRLNSRGCVVAVDSALAGAKSVTLPWSPAHEAPGWWQLLRRRYFPGAQKVRCESWEEVIRATREPGPGTRGVVWVRREVGGMETSGHLIHVHADGDGQVVLLDGMTGGLAQLEPDVRALTLARVAGGRPPGSAAWEGRADGFAAAVVKAETWLRHTYREPVVLVDPAPGDESARGRGWLFACNTEAYVEGGDWRQAMVDAAVVVPKAASPPFLLSNAYPWRWFEAWDDGREPSDAVLPELSPPPEPDTAAWLPSTLRQLGPVLSVSEHRHWAQVFDGLRAMPAGARALVWVRRRDSRGRESVGYVLTGLSTQEGPAVLDGGTHPVTDLAQVAADGFRLIRYR